MSKDTIKDSKPGPSPGKLVGPAIVVSTGTLIHESEESKPGPSPDNVVGRQ